MLNIEYFFRRSHLFNEIMNNIIIIKLSITLSQSSSSDPSSQLSVPSQSCVGCIQCSFAHWNCPGVHLKARQDSGSSDPSTQSIFTKETKINV